MTMNSSSFPNLLFAAAAVNLEFDPMAFFDSLQHMGIGKVVIFAIIGAVPPINRLFSG